MPPKPLSYNEIAKLLSDNFLNEEDKKQRCKYFQTKLTTGYKSYRKTIGQDHEVFSYDLFAFEVINRHNRRYFVGTQDFKNTYFKNDTYLDSLIKDTIVKFQTLGNRDYILQRKREDIGDVDIIVNQYLRLIKDCDRGPKGLVKRLAEKSLTNMIVGIDLIARGFIEEALILWRSYLEEITVLIILNKFPNEPLETRFMTNKEDTLVNLGLKDATSAHKDNLRGQTTKHLGKKSAKEWEILRFSWVGNLIKKQDYSSATLRNLAGLSDYDPHYVFTSIFVHERDINDNDIKIMRLSDYALILYWKLFDETLRPLLMKLYPIPKNLPLDKSESDIRAYLRRKFGERFNEMAAALS